MQQNSRLDLILSYVIHNPAFARTAFTQLTDEHFNLMTEQHYRLLWQFLKIYYQQFSSVPSQSVLKDSIKALSRENTIISKLEDSVLQLIDTLYSRPSSDFQDTAHANRVLQDFLGEVLKRNLAKNLELASDAPTIKLPKILQEAEEKLRHISTITNPVPTGSIVDALFQQDVGDIVLTGLPFIDDHMKMRTKNVNVLLGPTGGGKTTLACQILTQAALTLYADDRFLGREPSGWFAYFGYEGPIGRSASLMMSYAARIPRNVLVNLRSLDELSTTERPSDSDRELRNRGEIPRLVGQRERFEEAQSILSKYVKIFDFSGGKDKDGRSYGHGGIDEIASFVDHHCSQTKLLPKLIVIDWAGMVVQRYISAHNQSDKNLIIELGRFVDKVYNKIASPYNCVVLVVHQLRGAVQRNKTMCMSATHADAAWCSDFGVNASYVFCLGDKDPDTNVCLLRWTKTRDGKTPPPIVCQLDGELSRFVTVDDLYQYDYVIKQIVPREKETSRKPRVFSVDF